MTLLLFYGAELPRGWALQCTTHPRLSFRLNSAMQCLRPSLELKLNMTHCRCPRWTWGESRTPFCGRGAPPACTPAGSSVGSCSSRRSGAGSGSLLPEMREMVIKDPKCTKWCSLVCVCVCSSGAETKNDGENHFSSKNSQYFRDRLL